jgi:hypothetical protein
MARVFAQQISSPLEKNNYLRVTSYDELTDFVKQLDEKSDLLKVETMGQSMQGRNLYTLKFSSSEFGKDKSKIKVLFFAQQHGNEQSEHARRIQLKHLLVICGSSTQPVASVVISVDGEEYPATEPGNGPVDAAFNAVKQIIRKTVTLEEFLIQAITRGSDDIGKVHFQLENKGTLYYGFSANTDIVTASVEAFIDALSKIG